jgi:hypothetical protein
MIMSNGNFIGDKILGSKLYQNSELFYISFFAEDLIIFPFTR